MQGWGSGLGGDARCRADGLISQKVLIRSFCKCQFPHKFVNGSVIITVDFCKTTLKTLPVTLAAGLTVACLLAEPTGSICVVWSGPTRWSLAGLTQI